ncbi:MAG: 4-hydroxybenzoate 3-monooxygenase [Actinomycetota bacterium]
MRTQVGIVGGGPSGLMLSHLLHLEGIESVVLEARSRDYVEKRVRAGVLEQGTVDLLVETGLGDRLKREGLVHHGLELRFGGRGHRIALSDLTGGRAISIYGQQEVVKDMIVARLDAGATIHFEVDDVRLSDLDSPTPTIRHVKEGAEREIVCDFVAGCDGFHGVSRGTFPAGVLRAHDMEYPFRWLGILAEVAPSTDELIYCSHERGFALHSLRSPTISRLYLQVEPDEEPGNWPDERIWEELRTRFATDDGWTLADGPIIEKGVTPIRGYVVEPMQFGRLFLAGDAAHIVPATGAKGLNLAVADVLMLSRALAHWYRSGDAVLLEQYSTTCLRRVWRVQEFSYSMSSMLHRFPDDGPFEARLRRARLEYTCSSEAAARSLAENYVGLPYSV